MTTKILLVLSALFGLASYGQQDWPHHSSYVYFGSNLLDQSQHFNYALLQHKTNGDTFLNSPEELRLRINNTDKVIVANNGNVGIGTTNPAGILEVRSTNNNGLRFNHGNTSSISFLPNDGDSQFHISHTLDNRLTISHGASVAQGKLLTIKNTGEMGIGTTSPDAKLAVNGNIHAKEVKVDLVGWPDYVLTKGYDLPPLAEVEQHILEKGHLINIPSAKEVEENGIQLGEMNKLLLEKIEELMLYTLQQQKEILLLRKQLKKVDALQEQINNLLNQNQE